MVGGFKPWYFLMWGNSTNHCTTVQPMLLHNGNVKSFKKDFIESTDLGMFPFPIQWNRYITTFDHVWLIHLIEVYGHWKSWFN